MIESDEQLQTNTYVWSQSIDQVTISFLVPESAKARDLDIVIERKYLKAGIKGQEPVFQVHATYFSRTNTYTFDFRLSYATLLITLNHFGN